MPEFARSHVPATAEAADEQVGETSARGHIGLIVLSSIVVGLGLGLVLDVLVFGGRREPLITGSALISIAIGYAMLAQLSARRTNQPQGWARVPAISFGLTGAAMLLRPSGHVLGLLGWVWPVLLLVLVVLMFRGSRRSLHNWSRRTLLYPAFVLLALIALGGAFETVTKAATSNNPPSGGRTYTVAGHSLYLRCTGLGSPTVVLFNGLGERTPSWAWVQGDVARHTRVCVFDRAGQGWSGKGVGRQDAHQLSADVQGLLTAANVPGPYVLAGHSVGGTYALAYAMDYPEDVAGVALIDSATPYQFDLSAYPPFYWIWRRASALLPTVARAGGARIYSLRTFGSLPPDARRAARAFGSSPRELRADRDEFAQLRTVFRQDKALTSLGRKPLFVLSADVGDMSGWSAAQKRLARLSTNSVHRTAHGATHAALIEDSNYAAVSGRAIEAVVRSVRLTTALGSPPMTTLKVPAPTGAFHVGTRSIALTDRARREPEAPEQPRSLPIQLWYPAAAGTRSASYMPSAVARFLADSAGVQRALLESVKLDALADVAPLTRKGGWPVVLFSPGFGVERELYAGMVEDLASHGYVVVAIDHPHDASIVEFPDGHVVRPRSQMDIMEALTVRVADTRFVLTELARLDRAGFFAGRLDLDHVGMFGHSLGGAAAASAMLVDPRIDAGADLDGALFGGARLRGLSRPFMLMSGEPGFASDPNRAGFWSRLRAPHYAVDIKDAQHFAFSDLAFFAPGLTRANPRAGVGALVGSVDGPATLAAERAYLVAFFDRFLRGNHEPLLTRTPGPFAGVRLTVGR